MWHSLRTKGLEGMKADVAACLQTAEYLRDQLRVVRQQKQVEHVRKTLLQNL